MVPHLLCCLRHSVRMRALTCLLLSCCLAAQEAASIPIRTLEMSTELGTDPATRIHLAPSGCWNGLILGAAVRPAPPTRRGGAEATVEVWDLLPPSSPRQEAFWLYQTTLRERLSKAWLAPPPSHGFIELGEIMQNNPSEPQKLDITKVKSMQERYNRMPPNGSPVK